MIAGNYLGEIFRQVIVEMVDEGVLFLGQVGLVSEQDFINPDRFCS